MVGAMRIRWAEAVSTDGKNGNECIEGFGKPEGKRPLRRPRRR
jgi:hypothetical protein